MILMNECTIKLLQNCYVVQCGTVKLQNCIAGKPRHAYVWYSWYSWYSEIIYPYIREVYMSV